MSAVFCCRADLMPFPTAAAFQAAAQLSGLTDAALYTPAGGNALAIAGRFTSDYVEPFGMVEATQPAFFGAASQFAAGDPKQGDAITITSADASPLALVYRVKTVKQNTPQVGDVLMLLKV